jgi:hypothetical protein
MKHNVYEIMPMSASHYLFENGQPIARFNELAKAEAAHAQFVAEIAQLYERNTDRLIAEESIFNRTREPSAL